MSRKLIDVQWLVSLDRTKVDVLWIVDTPTGRKTNIERLDVLEQVVAEARHKGAPDTTNQPSEVPNRG